MIQVRRQVVSCMILSCAMMGQPKCGQEKELPRTICVEEIVSLGIGTFQHVKTLASHDSASHRSRYVHVTSAFLQA